MGVTNINIYFSNTTYVFIQHRVCVFILSLKLNLDFSS